MKKLLLVFFPLILFSNITHTQRADNTNAAAYKEAKAALKQKEKQDITEALKEAGVPG